MPSDIDLPLGLGDVAARTALALARIELIDLSSDHRERVGQPVEHLAMQSKDRRERLAFGGVG